MANLDGRVTIKIGGSLMSLVKAHKKATRIPVGEFIDTAIAEKLGRLPDDLKSVIGVKQLKKDIEQFLKIAKGK